jgi:hypothetical protein
MLFVGVCIKRKAMLLIRIIVLLFFVLATAMNAAFGQLSGEIVNDGRKLITPFNYLVKGTQNGVVTVEIAVNIDGDVTSVQVIPNESTLVSTPSLMAVKNHIKTLKFEKGYHYPKFHRGRMKIMVEKEEE